MKNLLLVILVSLVPLFSFSQKKVGVSILYNGNLPKAAWGFSIEKEIKNTTIFFDYKIGGMFPAQDRVKTWTSPEEMESQYYSYGVTEWGSYVSESSSMTTRYGTAIKPSIFNLGLGKEIKTVGNTDIRINVGFGLCKEKNQLVRERSFFDNQIYNLELVDYHESFSDLNVYYEVIGEKNTYKVNFTSNILFEKNNTFIYGCGFDTKPMGFNLIFGFKF
jgi:hypothetical protein